MASNSYQNEVPKARINIKLDLHTGGAQRKLELPLKLMVMGDYSNGREQRPLSERGKVAIDRNNFDSVLAEFHPSLQLQVPDTLATEPGDTGVALSFRCMKDFEGARSCKVCQPAPMGWSIRSRPPCSSTSRAWRGWRSNCCHSASQGIWSMGCGCG
jgi:predicted component of type VI protein secretion system